MPTLPYIWTRKEVTAEEFQPTAPELDRHWGQWAGEGNWTLGCCGSSDTSPWRRRLALLWADHSQRTASRGLWTSRSSRLAIFRKFLEHSWQPKKCSM